MFRARFFAGETARFRPFANVLQLRELRQHLQRRLTLRHLHAEWNSGIESHTQSPSRRLERRVDVRRAMFARIRPLTLALASLLVAFGSEYLNVLSNEKVVPLRIANRPDLPRR